VCVCKNDPAYVISDGRFYSNEKCFTGWKSILPDGEKRTRPNRSEPSNGSHVVNRATDTARART